MTNKFKITKLFAFVAIDNDEEGIVSMQMGNTHMPLIGADRKRVDDLREYAKIISEKSGKKIILKKFKLVSEEGI